MSFRINDINVNNSLSENFMFIETVKIPKSSQNFTVDQKLLPSEVYFNFADIELSKVRSPRECF